MTTGGKLISSKAIAPIFYENGAPENPKLWRCVLCDEIKTQISNSGRENLMKHLDYRHKGYRAVAEECIATGKAKATADMFADYTETSLLTKVDATEAKAPKSTRTPRRQRGETYSMEDIEALLSYIEEILPFKEKHWSQVLERYHDAYAKPNGRSQRLTFSIKQKFKSLLVTSKWPALSDPGCPPEVRRARRIREKIRQTRGWSRVHQPSDEAEAMQLIVDGESEGQHDQVSSDDETIPDEEMAAYADADSDYHSDAAVEGLTQRKRPRLTEPSSPSPEARTSLVARVDVIEHEIQTLREEVKSVYEVILRTNDALDEENTKRDALREQLEQFKSTRQEQQTVSTSEEAGSQV